MSFFPWITWHRTNIMTTAISVFVTPFLSFALFVRFSFRLLATVSDLINCGKNVSVILLTVSMPINLFDGFLSVCLTGWLLMTSFCKFILPKATLLSILSWFHDGRNILKFDIYRALFFRIKNVISFIFMHDSSGTTRNTHVEGEIQHHDQRDGVTNYPVDDGPVPQIVGGPLFCPILCLWLPYT